MTAKYPDRIEDLIRRIEEALPIVDRLSDVESTPRNPGATEEQLEDAERKLGVSLPEDHRAFLTLNNGWPGMWDFEWFSLQGEE